MRKVLVGALLASTAVVPVYAADMNYPVKAQPPMVATPTSNWGGFYVGIDGGYGWGSSTIDALITTTGLGGTLTQPFANPTSNGFLFGGHVGYNWQFSGNVVAGLEVDYLGADLTGSQTVPVFGGLGNATLATKVDALASGRGKLGYALNQNVLLYGTGGVAWGHESATATLAQIRPAASISETAFANQFGWVVGGGAEFKVLSNILLRAQFLHYGFGDVAYTFPVGLGPINGANARTTVNAVTGGLSYKFDAF